MYDTENGPETRTMQQNLAIIEEGLAPKVPTETVVKSKEDSWNSSCIGCIQLSGACSLCVLLLGLIGGAVTYYVFSIIGLTEISHNTVQNRCSDSNLWSYLLTVLIINIIVGNTSKKGAREKDTGETIMSAAVSLIITVSLCTWGSIEFWNTCVQDKLSDTLLFKMVEVTIYLQYCIITIIIFVIFYTCRKISSDVETSINNA